MKLVIQKKHLLQLVIVGSIVGYPLVAGLATAFDLENRLASILLRASVLAAALILLLMRKSMPSKVVAMTFIGFWVLYLLRLAYTFFLDNEVTSIPASEFWLWAVGICLVPSLAVLFYRDFGRDSDMSSGVLIFGLVAAIIVMAFGGTAFITTEGFVRDQNRWNLSGLNPISLGHLGASLFLVASGTAISGLAGRAKLALSAAAGTVGVVVMFLANSRGPMIAAIIAIAFLALSRVRDRRTWFYGGLIGAAGLFVIIERADLIFGHGGIVDRFSRMIAGQDLSAEIRVQIYQAAIDQFLNSPYVGDGVEVRLFSYYPHNAILEAFMTTGVIGGAAFLAALFIALRGVWYIFKAQPEKIWLGLLLVQYIIAAQLSGAIYQSGAMWVLMAGVLSFSRLSEQDQGKAGGAASGQNSFRHDRQKVNLGPISNAYQ